MLDSYRRKDERASELLASRQSLVVFAAVAASVALIGLLAVGIGYLPWPSDVDCFEGEAPSEPATDAERLALFDARARQASDCSEAGRQCQFDVRTKSDEVIVFVQGATLSYGGCAFMLGDHAMLTYDRAGFFKEFVPGI